jgi:TolB-like protein
MSSQALSRLSVFSLMPSRLTLAAAVAVWALQPAAAAAQALEGRLVQVQGEVRSAGNLARVGQAGGGSLLTTSVDGSAQVLMADGSLIALPPASEIQLPKAAARQVGLQRGGLTLQPARDRDWQVDLAGRSLRTNGFLRLQDCGAGCSLPAGLYGRIAQGEAVLEYQGGRSVLRGRSFRWADANSRPEVLANAPALLTGSNTQAAGTRARAEVVQLLKQGLEAFNRGEDAQAVQTLEAVRRFAPGETLVPYYMGLIALRREDNAAALNWLQQYAREDPEGAAARDVPKTLTLLSSTQLQQEMAAAVAREREVVTTPPEPGSIAVQAFVNQGDANYRAMAKGLAAMIIADLSKVPGLKVLEREKVQLLVNEAKLGDSGLADTASAVRSGRLMRAEKVVVGNFEVK